MSKMEKHPIRSSVVTDNHRQPLHIQQPRNSIGMKTKLWIAVLCSAFVVLSLINLILYAEIRTNQTINRGKFAELKADQSKNMKIIKQLWTTQVESLTKMSELRTNQSNTRATVGELRTKQLQTSAQLRDEFLHLQAAVLDGELVNGSTTQLQSYMMRAEERISTVEANQKEFLLRARDCKALLDKGLTQNGVYTIYPGGIPVDVWCDMTANGSIVLTKRYDGSVDFNTTFQYYADGFGDLITEFWLGLKYVHLITETGNWTLRIDLEDFKGERRYAEYSGFRIGAGPNFTLHYDANSYRGNADDSLTDNNGMKFTTKDVDQDKAASNCALKFGGGGGWWYNTCGTARTTGMPYGEGHAIWWSKWKNEVLRSAVMKITRTELLQNTN